MHKLENTCLALEKVVRLTVWLGALLFPALIIVCVYEVGARYLFNASQIWAFDITFMLHGALFMWPTGFKKKSMFELTCFPT